MVQTSARIIQKYIYNIKITVLHWIGFAEIAENQREIQIALMRTCNNTLKFYRLIMISLSINLVWAIFLTDLENSKKVE